MKSKSGQRGILFQIEVWKSQESFTYFKIFKPISWGKDPLSTAADFFRGSLIVYRLRQKTSTNKP